MALAEVIEEEVKASQYITGPMLEARTAELKVPLAELEARMFYKTATLTVAAGLSSAGIVIAMVYFMLQHFTR
jgi:hypothetical protein